MNLPTKGELSVAGAKPLGNAAGPSPIDLRHSSECQVDIDGTTPRVESPRFESSRRHTKVAVISLLFSWPSTGGGNVHTAELVVFLRRAGFDVRHFFAQHDRWGVGQVSAECPARSEPLVFDDDDWHLVSVQHAFRQAINNFSPDWVIITDSWNFKPHLARAAEGYPFLLRLQALECLCPLNNVRLLPGAGQCSTHQFADRAACIECLAANASWSGPLHQAERALSQVDSAEYGAELQWAFREADAVLVVNSLTAAMLGPYCRRVEVIPSGFDAERFTGNGTEETYSRPRQLRQIFLAALVQEAIKGFHVVHEACARLWQVRRDFELVVTGDPPGQFDDFTRFIGWQDQNTLPQRMREADIVVVPAIAQEALGRTAVEAMGAGRPVIASRIGGLPETIQDGAGLLCEPGNPTDLARKIVRLLDDPALCQQMGEAGRRRFDDHFRWESIIERHYLPLLTRQAT